MATAIVAMVISTLNGLDRVPQVLSKVARIHRMGRIATALLLKLPAAAPHLFTGVKLAVSYAFIGVIASEFILAPADWAASSPTPIRASTIGRCMRSCCC